MSVEYKGFNVKGDGKFGYYSIHTIGKGSLPDMLKGVFTNMGEAKKNIDGYVEIKSKE